MAYNSSGGWDYEDDGVAKRIAGIISGGSPLMKQAATTGYQAANRRGLGNSSMAVGAAQNEVLRAATPIASQEAQQTYGKNLQRQQGDTSIDLATRQIAAQERQQLATSAADLSGQSLNAISNTLANDKIPAATRAAVQQSINDRVASTQRYLESLYGVNVNGTAPAAVAGGTSPSGLVVTGYAPDGSPIYGLPSAQPQGFRAALNI